MTRPIRLRAFAKINTGLKILGKRADGFHEIRTLYQTVALHDDLTIQISSEPEIAIECSDPSIPSGRGNLVYRAFELWSRARKFKGGFRAEITKSIPAGGGLGGGSSDAAATLLGLERLAGNRLDPATRFEIAARLGSDVPLFLLGGRVLGCGRGEEVYPITDLPARHCLIVHPGFAISTPEAYREAGLKLTRHRKGLNVSMFGVWSQCPMQVGGPAENDFETFVFAKWPELGRIKDQFIRAGAETASLTGSGSAVYGLFVSARQLTQAAKTVPAGWSVFRTQTLSRERYRRLIFAD